MGAGSLLVTSFYVVSASYVVFVEWPAVPSSGLSPFYKLPCLKTFENYPLPTAETLSFQSCMECDFSAVEAFSIRLYMRDTYAAFQGCEHHLQ